MSGHIERKVWLLTTERVKESTEGAQGSTEGATGISEAVEERRSGVVTRNGPPLLSPAPLLFPRSAKLSVSTSNIEREATAGCGE